MSRTAAQVLSLASQGAGAKIVEGTDVTEVTIDPIPQLVLRHRKLKVQRDAVDEKMKKVKADLRPEVEAIGDNGWKDDAGYARMVVRKDSVGYTATAVNHLATTWSESEDPIMQSCGRMLLGLRKEKAGFSYLQVK